MKALRVLVVEDNQIIGMLLGEMLAGMGHDVCGLETTEAAAVAAAERYKPDIIIMDAQLSKGSGVAAMRAILRTGPMPHLFISGAHVATDSPAAVVLQKPFDERQLVSAMDHAMAAGAAVQAPPRPGQP
jgi:CheY-like chemotaxis protein